MSWSILQDVPNPHIDLNGDPYSGAVLKAFLPGTTTSTSIAIDSSGSSPQASITYNAEGKLEVSGNEILPYIDRKVKWGIFANATDAAANTPFQMGPFDNVEVLSGSTTVVPFDVLNDAVISTSISDGDALNVKERTTGNGGGAMWDVVLSSTVTPSTDQTHGSIITCTGIPTLSLVKREILELDAQTYGMMTGSAAVDNAAWNAIQAETEHGQIIHMPTGTTQGNFSTDKTPVQGQGSSTKIEAFGTGGFAFTLDSHLPQWDFQCFRDMTIDGQGEVGNGVDYGTDVATGRWDFSYVQFEFLEIAVLKQAGNIGNYHYRSAFKDHLVGYKALGTPLAPFTHAGNDVFHGCHWQGVNSACYFLNDDVSDGGQITFDHNIFEGNTGTAIAVQKLAKTMPYIPLLINRSWFELNAADGGTKTVDGYNFNNVDINIADAGIVEANGTYLKNVQLQNTTMVARACRFDVNTTGVYLNTQDDDSAFVIHDFYGDKTAGMGLFIQNYAHAAAWDENNIAFQYMAHRAIRTAQGAGFIVAEAFDSGGTYNWSGTNSIDVPGDGLTSGNCTELTFNSAGTKLSTVNGQLGTGWNVITLGFKQTLGTLGDIEVNFWDGSSDRFGATGARKFNQWQTGVALVDNTAGVVSGLLSIYLRFTNTGGTIRFADFQLMNFTKKQDAIDYIDSREYQV